MHTGVLEWCLDWHGTYPGTDQIDPVGPASGIARIVRGGSVQEQVPYYIRSANRAGAPQSWRGQHLIGFRIVEASLPDSRPVPLELPFVQRCVKQVSPPTGQRLDPDQPHYRKRWILPIPPENVPPQEIRATGLHPAILGHNHSPALEVCPNGDLLATYYSAVGEYSPDVALIATRLRYGNEQWDMPTLFFDLPDINDVSPLLWNDRGTLHLFSGRTRNRHPSFPVVVFK